MKDDNSRKNEHPTGTDPGHEHNPTSPAVVLDGRIHETSTTKTTDETSLGVPSSSTTIGDVVAAEHLREELPGLPRLNYNLWHHKTKLSIVTALLVLESSLLPIALFYGLRYTSLRIGLIFAVITSFFGIVTGIEYGFRILKLINKKDTYRPLGTTSRWCFDYTHHTLGIGYFYMSAVLIGASVPHTPPIRPLAMPVCLIFIQAGTQLVVHGWMHARRIPAPFRISSIPKGGPVPPLVYTLVEDIIAVDGNAGKDYRMALQARYAVSPPFRKMLVRMNWFWGVGALVDGIGTLIVIWTVPEVIAYGVGWGSPFVFVLIWTTVTLLWVRKMLRDEKTWWVSGRNGTAMGKNAV